MKVLQEDPARSAQQHASAYCNSGTVSGLVRFWRMEGLSQELRLE